MARLHPHPSLPLKGEGIEGRGLSVPLLMRRSVANRGGEEFSPPQTLTTYLVNTTFLLSLCPSAASVQK